MARARGSDVVQSAGMPFTIQTLSSRVKGRRFRSGLGYLDDGRCEAGPQCLCPGGTLELGAIALPQLLALRHIMLTDQERRA